MEQPDLCLPPPASLRPCVPASLRSCVPASLRSCVPAFLRSCVSRPCVPASRITLSFPKLVGARLERLERSRMEMQRPEVRVHPLLLPLLSLKHVKKKPTTSSSILLHIPLAPTSFHPTHEECSPHHLCSLLLLYSLCAWP